VIRRVVLLRHGRTAWNAERRMQGRLDPPLDDAGEAQAAAVAPVVAGFEPVVLISSDLTRALQTALAVGEATGLEPRKEPRLRETDVGEWQGLVDTEVEAGWPGGLDRWRVDPAFAPPGGESRVDAAERALPVLHEVAGEPGPWAVGDTAVLVAHGGTIMALTCAFLGWPVEQWPSLGPLGNCRWSMLEFRIDRWRLAQWGAPHQVNGCGRPGDRHRPHA
jgi:glucosyl-3-phosphoglycerate phosphatase